MVGRRPGGMMAREIDGTYLIIGGTTKAATTSVYFYLAEHPEICASSMKEPRFFLDDDYPVKSTHRLERDGPERYLDYYRHCTSEPVRMEATPDYLHSPGSADRIRRHLPGAEVVFLLREPIARMESWFRFARQDGMISRDVDFQEFVEGQVEEAPNASTPQHLRVLAQGRYAPALERWRTSLGPERVHVMFFEDLVEDAASVVADICDCMGLDPGPLSDLDYAVHNPTRPTRFPRLHAAYKRLRYAVRQFTHDKPHVHALMRALRKGFERIYWRVNRGRSVRVEASLRVRSELMEYYSESVAALAELSGRPLPKAWRRVYDG